MQKAWPLLKLFSIAWLFLLSYANYIGIDDYSRILCMYFVWNGDCSWGEDRNSGLDIVRSLKILVMMNAYDNLQSKCSYFARWGQLFLERPYSPLNSSVMWHRVPGMCYNHGVLSFIYLALFFFTWKFNHMWGSSVMWNRVPWMCYQSWCAKFHLSHYVFLYLKLQSHVD